VDQNLWHRSAEAGVLEDPGREPPPDAYALTVAPERAPDDPAYVEIGFERGLPVTLDGERLDPVSLIQALTRLGGAHGVGRTDMVENRLVGMKVRGLYECPAGAILTLAHQDLESITLDRDTQHYAAVLAPRYAELVYYGQWFSPLREALDGFFEVAQRTVTGTVRVKLYKGACTVAGRASPVSLYRQDLATFGEDATYNQADAAGFIRLWGLPTRVFAEVHPAQARRSLRPTVG
jgi:argininosuccinate synthase